MRWWPWTWVRKSELDHLRHRDAIGKISAQQAMNAFAEVKELKRQIRQWELRTTSIVTSQLKRGDLLVVELPSALSGDSKYVGDLEKQIRTSLPQVEPLFLLHGVRLKEIVRVEAGSWT